ncbi:MAG TPA: hypothetical protein VHV83_21090, partial [Armatimonadota bacterium]|nr:hypothetical protein [Armatimonadota bacterium]
MQPRSSIAAFLLIVCSLALLVVGWGSYKKVLAHNLHLAAKAGDSPQVETLLKRGANINAVEQYQTPIMRAIEEHQ